MKKQAIIKKLHKPVRPALSLVAVAGAVGVFIIILVMSTRISQQPSNQNSAIVVVSSPTLTQTSGQPTLYHSKFMQITFTVPNGFRLTDETNDIILKNDVGEMDIDNNGTNFGTLGGYLQDLSQKNKFIVTHKQELVINHLHAISGFFSSPINKTPEDKVFLFYPASFSVVTVSTKSPALYSTLDQLAHSIKYAP